MRRSRWWTCCGLILVALPTHAATAHLTAISQYLKGGSETERWETALPGSVFSLFLIPSSNPADPFVNGPIGSPIDIALHAGDNDFIGVMDAFDPELQDPTQPFGMSLRFDNAGAPGISVTAPANTGAADQPFTADGDPVPTFPDDGTTVTGANSLSVTIDGQTITLTKYQLYLPSVFQSDQVDPFATIPDAFDDLTVKFTLHVEDASATPLPSAAMAGATLLPLMILGTRPRRARK